MFSHAALRSRLDTDLMDASKNLKIGITVVAASALAAGGAAYANTKHRSAATNGGLTPGYFVSAQSGATTKDGPRHGRGDDFAAAASYLGLTATELQTQLQAGKTLGQVADGTSGKSKAGLIAALVAHEKDELAAAVKAGRLTQAQADQITTDLTQRFTDLVNGVRGPGGPDGHHGPGDELAVVTTYLGLTQAQLQTQLEAGKTLGQIADATSGKSKAGLIAALVAAEKTELAAAVKAGTITQAQADQITTDLTQRFTDLVNGVRGPGGPDGDHHGHGFGGPPPAPGTNGYRALPGTHI